MFEKMNIKDNIPMTKVNQIFNFIRKESEIDNIKSPTKLPSIINITKRYKLSKDTIENAYKKLKQEGYLIAIKGKGYLFCRKKQPHITCFLA